MKTPKFDLKKADTIVKTQHYICDGCAAYRADLVEIALAPALKDKIHAFQLEHATTEYRYHRGSVETIDDALRGALADMFIPDKPGAVRAEDPYIRIKDGQNYLVPLVAPDGLVCIDERYLAPLADYGYHFRVVSKLRPVQVIFNAEVIAVIMPVLHDIDPASLRALLDACK